MEKSETSFSYPTEILLFSVGDQRFDDRSAIPLGLAVLKGSLIHHGYKVKCIDFSLKEFQQKQIYDILEKFQPKIVGLSATAYFIDLLKEMIQIIKSYSIEIAVIVGGYCSLKNDLISIINADAICHGEGDDTIIELVDHFMKPFEQWHQDIELIKGISFKKENKIIRTENRPLIQNLDELPFPDYSDFDFKEYYRESWIPFYSQRGCYNHCTFCDIYPFYGQQKIRSMSPVRIVTWIDEIYNLHKFRYFIFNDDNFMSTREFLLGLFEELGKKDLIGKIWINFQTRANDIIRFAEILPLIKPMIFVIELGFESFSDTQLKRFHKNTTRAINLKAIEILTKERIPFEAYYMFLDAQTTFTELEINVNTILSLPSIPYQRITKLLPEILINYQYNVWCDLTGQSTIDQIDFLWIFDEFLEQTESIKRAFILCRSLTQLKEQIENKQVILSDLQQNLILGILNTIFPLSIQLGHQRLQKALELSKLCFQNRLKLRNHKNRLLAKEIKIFNQKIEEMLSPIKKMGINFSELE